VEALQQHDENRMRRLGDMLQDREQRLKDHETGRRLLSDEEHATTKRQIEIYSNKLEQMQRETVEEKADKLSEMVDHMHTMNNLDYIPFDKTGLEG
jgi:hypothetical protein